MGIDRRRRLGVLVGALVLGLVLSGCGGASAPPPAPPTTATAAPLAGEDLTPDAARTLQAAVDDGAMPWRLEPGSVAQSFVSARFGWTDAAVTGAGPTTEVTGPGGATASLTMVQPARSGAGGVWAVSGGTRSG